MIATTARAVLCGAALLAFSGVAPAHADDDKPFRILSLSGTGEVRAVPDTASINTGVVSDAKDAKAALARNSAAMNRLFGQLKKAGIRFMRLTMPKTPCRSMNASSATGCRTGSPCAFASSNAWGR